MRKLFALVLSLALLISSPLYAAVGVKYGNATSTQATAVTTTTTSTGPLQVTDINIIGGPNVTFDGSTLTVDESSFGGGLFNTGHYTASTVLFSSSTAFQQANLPYAIVLKAILGAENDSLLPRGLPGQETTFQIYSVGQSGSWKIKPDVNAANKVAAILWTSTTFNAIGQSATMEYLSDALGWFTKADSTTAASAAPTIVVPSAN